ncbi:MAG: DUF3268 family zinc-finger domain-containing protein [Corallococcus sp.]|nr:DUF3268 family zinc-finger domain-containing protein [Corallococcus sp.]MCM1360011.1 DUF3268 family zinc-finger domain-containing protein [Corallococcus sp.]MCM1395568.1 DUF3268 family zinc-finger domain-containing protein [Corallococcus sp.]
MNVEQWEDIIKNGRSDVLEEILKQYADIFEKCESQEELYETAPTELLHKLTLNGDDEACAHYVRRRIDEDTLIAEDMKYLKSAILNLGFEAALLGGWLYGMKDCIYKDPFMEYVSYVVLEQYGNDRAHKLLSKAYKKDRELIEKAEATVLNRQVDLWAVEHIRGALLNIRVNTHRMEKDSRFPEYKLAYLTEVYLTETTGRETDGENIFVGYLRSKKRDDDMQRMTDGIIDEICSVADKMHVPTVDFTLEGKRLYHYGGGPTKKYDVSKDKITIISDAEMNVKVTDDTLAGNVCTACGGTLGPDGVCVFCGRKAAVKEKNGIYIKRSKDAEAMICTQCGAPVHVETGGNTAFCSACGTTFVINGNALKFEIPGLNYENIRADMPEGATLPDVKFVRASVADDRVTAIMPKNFIVMPEKLRRIKYRANAPRYIYTTPDSTVNLTMSIGGSLKNSDVFAFGQQMLSALKNANPTAQFGESKQITHKRNVFYFDFIVAGMDQKIYNAMFFFSFGGQQGMGSWNCLGKDRWYWAAVFEHAVKTMEFND